MLTVSPMTSESLLRSLQALGLNVGDVIHGDGRRPRLRPHHSRADARQESGYWAGGVNLGTRCPHYE